MMAARKPLYTFRHHARASRPDMMLSAGVAELVDALDLGSSDESRGGSNPSARTTPPGLAVAASPLPSPLAGEGGECRCQPDGSRSDASHRDDERRPEARVPRYTAGNGPGRTPHRAPHGNERSGADQRVPPRQGPGGPP